MIFALYCFSTRLMYCCDLFNSLLISDCDFLSTKKSKKIISEVVTFSGQSFALAQSTGWNICSLMGSTSTWATNHAMGGHRPRQHDLLSHWAQVNFVLSVNTTGGLASGRRLFIFFRLFLVIAGHWWTVGIFLSPLVLIIHWQFWIASDFLVIWPNCPVLSPRELSYWFVNWFTYSRFERSVIWPRWHEFLYFIENRIK